MLCLSYSSVSAYLKCPLSYRLRYVDRLPTKKTPALAFGSSLHGALEKFYSQPVPAPPTLERFMIMLDESWVSEGYADVDEETKYREHGRQVLAGFYDANAAAYRLPAAVEERFRLELDGVLLSGVIDRLDRLEDGGYEIIDYKSNRRLPARKYVEQDLQLSIYHMAVERVWGVTPSRVTMYYLVHNQPVSFQRTAQHVAEAEEVVMRTATLIGEGRFDATPNRLCDWCDYRTLCPPHSPPSTSASRM